MRAAAYDVTFGRIGAVILLVSDMENSTDSIEMF
jgi:hypothetical protein